MEDWVILVRLHLHAKAGIRASRHASSGGSAAKDTTEELNRARKTEYDSRKFYCTKGKGIPDGIVRDVGLYVLKYVGGLYVGESVGFLVGESVLLPILPLLEAEDFSAFAVDRQHGHRA